MSALDSLPSLNPYTPMKVTAAQTPVSTFAQKKMEALQANVAAATPPSSYSVGLENPPTPIDAGRPLGAAMGATETSGLANAYRPGGAAMGATETAGLANSSIFGHTEPSLVSNPSHDNSLIPTAHAMDAPQQQPLTKEEINQALQAKDAATVSARAYAIDPAYKAFVDHYQGGAIASLPSVYQKNFDDFALRTHYMLPEERTSDMQALGFQALAERKRAPGSWLTPKGFVQNIASHAAALTALPGATLAGMGRELIDPNRLTLGDFAHSLHNIFNAATGQTLTPEKKAPLYAEGYAKKTAEALEPLTGASYDTLIQKAAGDAGLISLFLAPPLAPLVAAAGGGAAEASRQDQEGETPSLGAIAEQGTKQGVLTYAAGKLIPYVKVPFGGSTALQRIANRSVAAVEMGTPISAASNTYEAARGRQTPGQALANTLESIPSSATTGALFQTGIEAKNFGTAAFHSYMASRQSVPEVNYQEAVQSDPRAAGAMNKGANASDVRMVQRFNPDEVEAAAKIGGIAKESSYDKLNRGTVWQVPGEVALEKLQAVTSAQDQAGKTLGAIRTRMSSDPTLQTSSYEEPFVQAAGEIGLTVNDAGNMVAEEGFQQPPAAIRVAKAWALLPDSDMASPQQLDSARSEIGKMLGKIPATSDNGGIRYALGALYHDLGESIVSTLSAQDASSFQQASGTYKNSITILDAWGNQLRTKADTGPLSPKQVKDIINTGDRAERAGLVARRLLTRVGEGQYLPAFDTLDKFVETDPYASQTDTTRASSFNLAHYAGTVESALKLNPSKSAEGIIDKVTGGKSAGFVSKIPIVGGIVSALRGNLGTTAWSSFLALDEYVHLRQGAPSDALPAGDIQAGAQAYAAREHQKADALRAASTLIQNGSDAEHRLTHLTGPAEKPLPALPEDDVPLSQISSGQQQEDARVHALTPEELRKELHPPTF